MATRWERLAGDTDRFAVRMAFLDDPDGGEAANSDQSISWGGFQLWVRGVNLCAHLEQSERVDHVYWYLLPLLEWFAQNWDPLLHEERLPCRSQEDTGWRALRNDPIPPFAMNESQEDDREAEWQQWWSRHALCAAREGGLFPDVVFRRLRDAIEVSWGPGQVAGAPAHVVFDVSQPSSETLSPRAVAEPLHEILLGASEYLSVAAPDSARILQLSQSIRRLSKPRNHERHMWLAGLGVGTRAVRSGWRRVRDYISRSQPMEQQAALLAHEGDRNLVVEGSCHAALMFGSSSPQITNEDVVTLCNLIVGLTRDHSSEEAAATGDHPEPMVTTLAPWSQGYDLAGRLHDRLDGRFLTGRYVDVDDLLDELGIEVKEVQLTDSSIRGVAIAGPRHRPGIAWNEGSPFNATPQGRRFTLAHELCHVLYDREVGRRLAIASGPWAPAAIERRANAFAAMLLMPERLVREGVAGMNSPLATEEGVDSIARQLQTGFEATLRHLSNLSLIDDIDRQRIQAQRREALEV